MNVREICKGSFTLPMAPEAALPLFTPEGERLWAGPDWAPEYPVTAAVADDSAPGTVFTTDSDRRTAIWIVTDRQERAIRYARVVAGRIAGTISVVCSPATSPDECRVTVEYDVTTLGPDGAAFVEELRGDYDGFLASWREEILGALGHDAATAR